MNQNLLGMVVVGDIDIQPHNVWTREFLLRSRLIRMSCISALANVPRLCKSCTQPCEGLGQERVVHGITKPSE